MEDLVEVASLVVEQPLSPLPGHLLWQAASLMLQTVCIVASEHLSDPTMRIHLADL